MIEDNSICTGSGLQQFASHDIDQLSELVWDWDLDFRQLESGSVDCGMTQLASRDLNFIRMSLNRIVDQQGGSAPGTHSFLTITDPSGWVEWCGQKVEENSLLYHGPRCNFETLTNQSWCAYITSISDTRLQQVAANLGCPEAIQLLRDSEAIKPADGSRTLYLRHLQMRYLASITDGALTGSALANYRGALEQEVCEEIIRIVMESQGDVTESRRRGESGIIQNTMGYIRANASEEISVADMAGFSGVSSRTLYRAFNKELGLSPKHCIKAIRLEGVRKQLKYNRAMQSVTDVANEWGFWHMGDFAHDYRSAYGELPSETLRR